MTKIEPITVTARARWLRIAAEETKKAGGNPEAIFDLLPDELFDVLVRNNLNLKYTGNNEKLKGTEHVS